MRLHMTADGVASSVQGILGNVSRFGRVAYTPQHAVRHLAALTSAGIGVLQSAKTAGFVYWCGIAADSRYEIHQISHLPYECIRSTNVHIDGVRTPLGIRSTQHATRKRNTQPSEQNEQ